jgi:hypothetical protein
MLPAVRSTCAKGWDTNDPLKSGHVGTNLTAIHVKTSFRAEAKPAHGQI